MTNHVRITRNGQEVDCYGPWLEDSNCVAIVCDQDGFPIGEEVYADGGANWTEVVEKLTAWAKRNGWTIAELQAC